MMIKLLNRGVVLGLTAAVLFSVAPAQTVAAAEQTTGELSDQHQAAKG